MSKLSREKLLKEQLRWYDKDHLWKWQEVRDFTLHITVLLQKKPEVTEEFVDKWAEVFFDTDTHHINEYEDKLKQMLKEAGVEVIK